MNSTMPICCHGWPYNRGFHLIFFPKRDRNHYELRRCTWKMEEVIKEETKKCREEKWSDEEIAWGKAHESKVGTS